MTITPTIDSRRAERLGGQYDQVQSAVDTACWASLALAGLAALLSVVVEGSVWLPGLFTLVFVASYASARFLWPTGLIAATAAYGLLAIYALYLIRDEATWVTVLGAAVVAHVLFKASVGLHTYRRKLCGFVPEVDFADLAALPSEDSNRAAIPSDLNARGKALQCANTLKSVPCYYARLSILDPTRKDLEAQGYVEIQWDLRFQAPDTDHVVQVIWGDENITKGAIDEWIDTGMERFQNLWMGWIEVPWEREFASQDRRLRVDHWVDLLTDGTPIRVQTVERLDREYLVLEYSGSELTSGFFEVEGNDAKLCRGVVWIDLTTGLLVKGLAEMYDTTDEPRSLVECRRGNVLMADAA